MKSKIVFVGAVLFLFSLFLQSGMAADDKFGIGIKGGINKLEGDWKEPRFNPAASFLLSYSPVPFFSINAEVNSSTLRTRERPLYFLQNSQNNDPDKYQTSALPLELDFRFNFSPYTTVNPFASIGFGALMWDARYDGKTLLRDGELQKGTTMFLKAGGGVELLFDNGIGLLAGADFRYTGIDLLDQNPSGDENDGIISVWAGINYYISRKNPEDLDRDNVPAKYDLDLYRAEDRNGFMDHDGKPEFGRMPKGGPRPRVIHYPVFRAETSKEVRLTAIISSSVPLKTVAVIFRQSGTKQWKILPMAKAPDGVTYHAVIRGNHITSAGLEYCMIAVDQTLKGIGYSGVPKRPIVMRAVPGTKAWRVVSGIAAFLGWGGAAYIVMRTQEKK